jgi:hypothetical protein
MHFHFHPEGSPHLKGYKISSDKSCNVEPVLRKTANDLAESQSKIQNLNSQLQCCSNSYMQVLTDVL